MVRYRAEPVVCTCQLTWSAPSPRGALVGLAPQTNFQPPPKLKYETLAKFLSNFRMWSPPLHKREDQRLCGYGSGLDWLSEASSVLKHFAITERIHLVRACRCNLNALQYGYRGRAMRYNMVTEGEPDNSRCSRSCVFFYCHVFKTSAKVWCPGCRS